MMGLGECFTDQNIGKKGKFCLILTEVNLVAHPCMVLYFGLVYTVVFFFFEVFDHRFVCFL
jgi:hypothetical protein